MKSVVENHSIVISDSPEHEDGDSGDISVFVEGYKDAYRMDIAWFLSSYVSTLEFILSFIDSAEDTPREKEYYYSLLKTQLFLADFLLIFFHVVGSGRDSEIYKLVRRSRLLQDLDEDELSSWFVESLRDLNSGQ